MASMGFNNARVEAEKAETAYNSARMGFNIAFGYDLMQNVTLTSNLREIPISTTTLGSAITQAMANRNELHGAKFYLEMGELTVTDVGATNTRSSSIYQEAAANLMQARATLQNAPKAIEADVRLKYMIMVQKKSEVDLGKANVASAKETYRLASLQYDAGMATLTDAQQAQIAAFSAELAFSMTLLEYNLAVIDYDQSYTVGTTTVLF
jgi:hypothetical protein